MNHEVIKKSADFQAALFAGRFSELAPCFAELANALERLMITLPAAEQRQVIQLLELILSAYEEQDYLRVADLLEYQLQPFAEKVEQMQ